MLPELVAGAMVASLGELARRHRKAVGASRGAPRADEVLFARTDDGWRIALHHFLPRGERRGREPVLLCHGLASCAATWDLGTGPSFARWLAARGHEVFALDLRGAGESDRPRVGGARRYGFGVHEYLTRDVPAAVARVLQASGAERLHWVGHSMGGILLLALAPGPLGERLASATTIGSAIDYKHGSRFGMLRGAASLLRLVHAAPVGSAARAYAPFAGARFPDEFMYAPENLSPELRRAIWASAFTWVPGAVLRELATVFEKDGFRGRDGARWASGLGRIATPLLAVAGSRDLQCPARATSAMLDAVGSKEKRFLLLDGFGHFDLVLSERAEREVFPVVEEWIDGHRLERRS